MKNWVQAVCRTGRPADEKKRSEEGFTLIELAIALAILGILVAVAVPTYLNVRNRAYDAEAKQVLGEIRATAWSHYLESNVWPGAIEDLGYDDGDAAADGFYETTRWEYSVAPNGADLDIIATGVAGEPTENRDWTLTLDTEGNGTLTGP